MYIMAVVMCSFPTSPWYVSQELEAAQVRHSGALASARSAAGTAAQQHEAATRQAEERTGAAQAEIQSLKQQVYASARTEIPIMYSPACERSQWTPITMLLCAVVFVSVVISVSGRF